MAETLPLRPVAADTVEAADKPMLVRRAEAARLCGVAVATWDRLDAAGKTPAAVRLGGAKLYAREDLELWAPWVVLRGLSLKHARSRRRMGDPGKATR